MTNEEAIAYFKRHIDLYCVDGICREAEETAIKALEQQSCDDAINRDMALEKMADYAASGYADSAEDFEEYSRIICQLPSVTRQTGEWIRWYEVVEHEKSTEHIPHCKCSVCNREQDPHSAKFINFCPNCGCRMVEPQESEE